MFAVFFLFMIFFFAFAQVSIRRAMFDTQFEMPPTNWVYVDAKKCFVATFQRPTPGDVLYVSCLLSNGHTEEYAEVSASGRVSHSSRHWEYVACVGRNVEVYAFTCGERRQLKLHYHLV